VPSSCFGFQALNALAGKHVLVQIAIGLADVCRRRPGVASRHHAIATGVR